MSYSLGKEFNYNWSEPKIFEIDYPLNKGLAYNGYYIKVYNPRLCRETIIDIFKLDVKNTSINRTSKKLMLNNNLIEVLDYIVICSQTDVYKSWNRKTIIEDLS